MMRDCQSSTRRRSTIASIWELEAQDMEDCHVVGPLILDHNDQILGEDLGSNDWCASTLDDLPATLSSPSQRRVSRNQDRLIHDTTVAKDDEEGSLSFSSTHSSSKTPLEDEDEDDVFVEFCVPSLPEIMGSTSMQNSKDDDAVAVSDSSAMTDTKNQVSTEEEEDSLDTSLSSSLSCRKGHATIASRKRQSPNEMSSTDEQQHEDHALQDHYRQVMRKLALKMERTEETRGFFKRQRRQYYYEQHQRQHSYYHHPQQQQQYSSSAARQQDFQQERERQHQNLQQHEQRVDESRQSLYQVLMQNGRA